MPARTTRLFTPDRKITTVRVEHRDVDVWLDDKGHFYAKGPTEQVISSKNLDGLKTSLRKVYRRLVPIAFQITLVEAETDFSLNDFEDGWNSEREGQDPATAEARPAEFRDVTVTGMRRHDIRYLDEDGDEEFTYSHSERICRRLTEEERATLTELAKRRYAADRDYAMFLKEIRITDIEKRLNAIAAPGEEL